MKLRSLWNIKRQNDDMDMKLRIAEFMISGDTSNIPIIPAVVKVFDDFSDLTRIKKIDTGYSIDQITHMVRDTIGRDGMLSIMVAPGVMKELDAETLKESFVALIRQQIRCLLINAI